MVKRNWGRIINLSSAAALGNRGQTNYSTAKAGLQGMAKTLAIELGRFGITANAVAPGFIDSDMTRAVAIRLGRDLDEFKAERAKAIPVGRVGVPRDVANVIAFLGERGRLVRLRSSHLRRRRAARMSVRVGVALRPFDPRRDIDAPVAAGRPAARPGAALRDRGRRQRAQCRLPARQARAARRLGVAASRRTARPHRRWRGAPARRRHALGALDRRTRGSA